MNQPQQQQQTAKIATKLNKLGHPIDKTFSCAKDFFDPAKDIIDLYIDEYSSNYDREILYDIYEVVSEMINIRKDLIYDMKHLGFDFEEGLFYKGLKNFSLFLDKLYESLTYRDGNIDKDEVGEEVLHDIILGEVTMKVESGINLFVNEIQELIADDINNLELKERTDNLILRLNNFLSQYNIIYENEPVFFSLGSDKINCKERRSDLSRINFTLKGEDISLCIDQKFIFINSFVEYIKVKDEFDESIEDLKPSDHLLKILEEEKIIYGAKGAYLRFLKSFLELQEVFHEAKKVKIATKNLLEIKKIVDGDLDNPMKTLDLVSDYINYGDTDDRYFNFNLLPSLEVGIDLYKNWKGGENIDGELKSIYDKSLKLIDDNKEELPANCDSLIVRSSAIYSEDNDLTSGAGVYESIKDIKDFTEFKEAIIKVYESVDLEKAIIHQENYQIEEELMGLVIQPFVKVDEKNRGYLNSSRPYIKHLLDFKTDSGFQATLNKNYLPMDLSSDRLFHFYISQHFNIDTWNDNAPSIDISNLVKMLYAFEYYLGKNLQAEFISDYVVQMRPIIHNKPSLLEKVTFLDESPVFEGRSINMGDVFSAPERTLILDSSFEATIGNEYYKIESGDIDLVIIGNSFSANKGHIETLCAEQGILCIIDNPLSDFDNGQIPRNVTLRGICDGDVGKVYLVD